MKSQVNLIFSNNSLFYKALLVSLAILSFSEVKGSNLPDSLKDSKFKLTLFGGFGAVLSEGEGALKGSLGHNYNIGTELQYQISNRVDLYSGISGNYGVITGSLHNNHWYSNDINSISIAGGNKGYNEELKSLILTVGTKFMVFNGLHLGVNINKYFHDFSGAGTHIVGYNNSGQVKYEVIKVTPEFKKSSILLGFDVRKQLEINNNKNFFAGISFTFGLDDVLTGTLTHWGEADSFHTEIPSTTIYSNTPPDIYQFTSRLSNINLTLGYTLQLHNGNIRNQINTEKNKNLLYLLAGGEGFLLTLNYERMLVNWDKKKINTQINARIGIGGELDFNNGWGNDHFSSFPVGVALLNGVNRHFMEFSPTMTVVNYRYHFSGGTQNFQRIALGSFVGYRYQAKKGFMAKIGVNPYYMIHDNHTNLRLSAVGEYFFMPGIAIGYSFN